jgi:acetyl esterase/lipase
VVASIDYRMGSLYQFPAEVQDAKSAVRYLRANAGTIGIDPNRIAAWGASSGASSAALLAMHQTPASWNSGQHQELSSQVQAVVDFSGPVDFALQGTNTYGLSGPLTSPVAGLFGQVIRLSTLNARGADIAASAVTYVGPDDPPFFIVHGNNDFVVPLSESQELAQRLRAAGDPVRLVIVPRASHVGVDPMLQTEIPAAVSFLSGALAIHTAP